jgi:hypothetical protein
MSDDGGPAFPAEIVVHEDPVFGQSYGKHPGMTLRDFFANGALQAINVQAHVAEPAAEFIAWSAYNIAEAMLKERNKR